MAFLPNPQAAAILRRLSAPVDLIRQQTPLLQSKPTVPQLPGLSTAHPLKRP